MAFCRHIIQSELGCDALIYVSEADYYHHKNDHTNFVHIYEIAAGSVTYTATEMANMLSSLHDFVRWEVDGVVQPAGQLAITLDKDANHWAIATYTGCSKLLYPCKQADGSLLVSDDETKVDLPVCKDGEKLIVIPPFVPPPTYPGNYPANYPLSMDYRRTSALNPNWGKPVVHLRRDWNGAKCMVDEDTPCRNQYTLTWGEITLTTPNYTLVRPAGSMVLTYHPGEPGVYGASVPSPYYEPYCDEGDRDNFASLELENVCGKFRVYLTTEQCYCYSGCDDPFFWNWTRVESYGEGSAEDFDCENGVELTAYATWVDSDPVEDVLEIT